MRREAIHAVFPARDMAVQGAPRSQEGASSIAHVTSIRHARRHPHPPACACHPFCLSLRALGVSHAYLKSNCCRGGPAPCEDVERDARAADNPRRAAPNAVPRVSRAEAPADLSVTRQPTRPPRRGRRTDAPAVTCRLLRTRSPSRCRRWHGWPVYAVVGTLSLCGVYVHPV